MHLDRRLPARAVRWTAAAPVATLAAALVMACSGCSTLGLSLGSGTSGAADSLQQQPPSQAEVAAVSVKAVLAQAHANLVALQADAPLAALAPNEVKDAEQALKTADSSQYDGVSGSHQVYVADHKVQLARARAETRQWMQKVEALRAQKAQITATNPAP